jgi:hypothetical protein
MVFFFLGERGAGEFLGEGPAAPACLACPAGAEDEYCRLLMGGKGL